MVIRDVVEADLPAIVKIYSAAIPGRMATGDLEPVSVESYRAWFREHAPGGRPIWVMEVGAMIVGWLSFQSFYGRPAYRATAEISIYVSPRPPPPGRRAPAPGRGHPARAGARDQDPARLHLRAQ